MRRTQPQTLDQQQLLKALVLCNKAPTPPAITRLLQTLFSPIGRALSRLGLGPLRNLDPEPTLERYGWDRPGGRIHFDAKSLARFREVGHLITSDRQEVAPKASLTTRSTSPSTRRHAPRDALR